MSVLAALQATKNLHDVATLLRVKPASLSYILYKLPTSKKYKNFKVPKSGGGIRSIDAPSDELKLLQSRLSDLLQTCHFEIQAGKRDLISHGFRRERSILTNAAIHRHRRFVFNLDLKDFFGSINFGRVRGFFIKNKHFHLSDKAATVLAQIACLDGKLPQGSPCSPIISNLVCHILDIRLVNLAAAVGCTYSRYADDLTFSTNRKDFPVEIAVPRSSTSDHDWMVGAELYRRIINCGFDVNQKKVRMQYRDSRQEVTGLVVNRRINVRREYRHNARAMVHNLLETGGFTLPTLSLDPAGNSVRGTANGGMDQLHGILGFIHSVDEKNGVGVSLKLKQIYRDFLFFKEFFSAQRPVLVFEGKTDVVYLTHAIRSTAGAHPTLAVKRADGSIDIKIRRFQSYHSRVGEVLGLKGGSDHLKTFIQGYRNACKKSRASGMTSPVVVVIDNDEGSKGIYGVIKEIKGSPPAKTAPFIHVTHNLYVVATPLLAGGNPSQIEDCFDSATLAKSLAGKMLSLDNNYDKSIYYGKADFAYKVVEPNASTISFSGFSALLTNIEDAIKDYSTKLVAPGTGTSSP